MPFERLNDESRLFLSRGYLLEGQTPEERMTDIAKHAEKILGIKGFADKFYNYLGKGYYSLSTPVRTNFGNGRGMPISCHSIEMGDSVADIMHTNGELGVMTKLGAGVGTYFGNLRPRGTAITNNGESSGSVHFMEMFDKTASVISQGCYLEDCDVLTSTGFKKFKDIIEGEDLVAQVDEYNNVTFTSDYTTLEKDYEGVVDKYSGIKRVGQFVLNVTEDHRMVVMKRKGDGNNKYRPEYTEIIKSKDVKLHRDNRMYLSGIISDEGGFLTPEERLMIAFQADGRKTPKTQKMSFHLQKQRKIDRLEEILNDCGFEYKIYKTKQGSFRIDILGANHLKEKYFQDWIDITNIDLSWGREFIEELSYRDGSRGNSIKYVSTNEDNIDFVQSICSIIGKRALKRKMEKREEHHKERYTLLISDNIYRGGESIKKESYKYKGKIYCVSVPEGRIIVREGGNTIVCGNSQRRGATTPYLPVEHGDIEEFLEIGTEGHPIQRCTTAVTISNKWMKEMVEGDKDKRKIRAKILKRRSEVGYPYITFVGNANEQRVDVYNDLDIKIKTSNICQEIFLATDEKHSFVCCLSSINLLHRDEIKDTDAVETMVMFLDAVMQEFINKLEALRDSDKKEDKITFHFMEKAYNFALRERAIGVGVLGWHSYLQSKMIAIESEEASAINIDIWKVMKEKTYSASKGLAEIYGEPSLLKGYGRRHSHLMAVAPTTSSAFILGQVSQSIEPLMSNYYTKNLAKHTATIKNIYLEELLRSKRMNNRDVWDSIRDYDGSVQHLDFLTQEEKQVFKTFKEIDQDILLQQASDRQKYIDQGQSLNTMITPSMTAKDVSNLCIRAWELGLKGLYYAHSINAAQETVRSIKQASDIEKVCYIGCKSCEA